MGEAMHRPEPLALSRLLGFRVEVYPERKQAHCVLDASEVHVNRSGVVHGGISATLLDTASGVTASLTVDDSGLAPFTTVSLNINYIAAARPGMLRAEGRLSGGGRVLTFVEGTLTDSEGRLIATSTGVFKRLRQRQGETS